MPHAITEDRPITGTVFYDGECSICIDGVSLTVNRVRGAQFEVNLIPHTLKLTTLSRLKPGTEVNLEADMVARYVERMLA